ncbi:MAG: hypothetical protein IBJ12_04860 [Sphingomonadaceae bacterium]|nr:hypothetical protein [Sphingomonadaceae bacterium]
MTAPPPGAGPDQAEIETSRIRTIWHPTRDLPVQIIRKGLSTIPKNVHDELHRELRKLLRDSGFMRGIGGRGGSGFDWTEDFSQNPGSQRYALDAVLDASRRIDLQYGTNITQDVWYNVIHGKFRIDP